MKIHYKGNRWYKCDLHLHTPASECFIDDGVTPEIFIEEVKKKGLECIAITDHNTAEWIDKIRDIAKMESIFVFPGVEITCSDSKVHLLILFDTEAKVIDIEDFIRDSGISRGEFGKQTAHSNKSVIEIAKMADKAGAIVIPAHIDCFSGLSEVGFQTQNDFLNLDNIRVVQMINKELITSDINTLNLDELHNILEAKYNGISKETVDSYIKCVKLCKSKNKGILTFSDNPSLEDSSKHGLWGIGKEYSLIKMGEKPTLEGLRQAFLFPEIRMKNYFNIDSKNNLLPEVWINKVIVKDIELLSGKELEVDFNPHLNTIIGGRGSGKSTIIRFLTGIFAEKTKIGKDEVSQEFKRFYSIVNGDTGVLRETTQVIVEIIKNNNKYRIIASDFKSDGKSKKTIEKYNKDKGIYEGIDDVSVEDLFSIDIYNQKQIYNLSRNPNILREKIDSLISSINEPKLNANKYMSEYKTKYSFVKQLETEVSMKKKIMLDLKDIEEKIDLYRDSGINEILKKYEHFNKQKSVLDEFEKGLENSLNNIKPIYEKFNLKPVNCDDIDETFRDEIKDILNNKMEKFNEYKIEFKQFIEKIESLNNDCNQNIKDSSWYSEYSNISDEYNNGILLLKTEGIDVKAINDLLEKQKNKKKELIRLTEIENSLIEKYNELNVLRDNYIRVKNEIYKLRKEEINNLLSDTNIKVKFKKFRDYNNFIEQFRKIIQRPNKFDVDVEKIAKKCFEGDIEKNLKVLVKDITEIKNTKGGNSEYTAKFNNVLRELNDEQIATLNLLLPEDDIQIQYKPNLSSEYKSLVNASAGQKTSAMLTFILSDGTTPLILDQPEDDLDNHLITDLVVERLKICKNKRQIVVVTHNANIPVNGDAELVVTMNSQSKDVEIFTAGTIEEKLVREEICNVMEGGTKAFKMRASRYSLG